MNRDELAALAALQRNLGWRILVREFQGRREHAISLMLNPDTPLEEVERARLVAKGVAEVLSWPKQTVDMHAPAEEIVRAGLYPAEEDING